MDETRLRPRLHSDKSLNAFYFLRTGLALTNLAWCEEKLDKIRFNPPELKTIKQSQMVSQPVCQGSTQTTVAKPNRGAEIPTWSQPAERSVVFLCFSALNTKQLFR